MKTNKSVTNKLLVSDLIRKLPKPDQLVLRVLRTPRIDAAISAALDSLVDLSVNKSRTHAVRDGYELLQDFCLQTALYLESLTSFQDLAMSSSIDLKGMTVPRLINKVHNTAKCAPIGAVNKLRTPDGPVDFQWFGTCKSRWCPWCHYRRFTTMADIVQDFEEPIRVSIVHAPGLNVHNRFVREGKRVVHRSWTKQIRDRLSRTIKPRNAVYFARYDFKEGMIRNERTCTAVVISDCKTHARIFDPGTPHLFDSYLVASREEFINTKLPYLYGFPPILDDPDIAKNLHIYELVERRTNHFHVYQSQAEKRHDVANKTNSSTTNSTPC